MCHSFGLVDIEDIRGGQQIHLMGDPDHFDFFLISHACFFQILAELAIDQTDGGEILDATETQGFQFFEEEMDGAERISAADSG